MKLSVIVPVYNVEQYILACLISIKKSLEGLNDRDRKKVEVLVIDDGSKDTSGTIAKEFCRENVFFKYYKKTNGGLSDARNFGLNLISSEYVSFIDSDDCISNDYFSTIFTNLDSDIDLLVFDWGEFFESGETRIAKGLDIEGEIWSVSPSAWNKVYKRTLFEQIEYPKGKWYEDVGTTYKIINLVENYKYLKKPLYQYRKNREGSILNTTSEKINDIYEVLEEVYQYYKQQNKLTSKNIEGLEYQYIKLLMWSNMYRQLKYYKYNIFAYSNKMGSTRELIVEKFPNWKSNRLLILNSKFFMDRLGKDYIGNLDCIGKSRKLTTLSLLKVVYLNKSRQ